MFRWNLMLGTLFGSRRRQPQARRTRTTKKLNLESLEDRTMPSASPGNPLAATFLTSPPSVPTVAAAASYAASTMNQLGHLMETVQQDVLGIVQTLDQRIIQEMSPFWLQWNRLLGIDSSPPSQPTASHPGSGSDNGAALTAQGNNPISGTSKVHPLTGGDPQMWFETSYTQVAENSGTCDNVNEILMVSLSAPSSQTVTATYTTSDQTAYAGIDYTYENGTVTFTPGQTVQSITIPILDDGTDEQGSGESFNVTLSNPNGATLGDPNVCQVNIMENNKQQASDTLVWNPCPDDGNDSSTVTNWYDWSQDFQLPAGSLGPNPSSPIIFDGTPNSKTSKNAPINWQGADVSSIQVGNGYNAQMTFVGDSSLTVENTLIVDDKSTLNAHLNTNTLKVKDGGTITNMTIDNGGLFDLAGGPMYIAQSSNFTENLGANLTIEGDATLYDQNQTTLNLIANNLVITVNGQMDLYEGPNNQNTAIGGGAANPNDYINVNGGTLVYYGRQNTMDTITVPIVVQNGGTFQVTVDENSTKPLQGTLIVQGGNASTQNVSVYMAGSSSSVTLDNSDTLECDNGYTQADGTLKSLDESTCTLKLGAGGAGTATVSGGILSVDTKLNTFGTLNVNGDLNFADAQLNVSIQGYAANGQAGTSDVLFVSGTLSIDPDLSTLYVNVYGHFKGDFWAVIQSNNSILGDFASESNSALANLTYGPPNMQKAGQYWIVDNNG